MMCRNLLFLLAMPAAAVPSFDIHLETAPELRWAEVTKYYMKDILAMGETFNRTLHNKFTVEELKEWADVLSNGVPKEFLDEFRGMEKIVNSPLWTADHILLFNHLYELESPTMCSGLLAAQEDGTVIHGRNMDYSFLYKMPDGSTHDWPDVTYDVNFWREGKKIITSVAWPMSVGIHTAMRYDGWTFEQNTRTTNNHSLNLEAGKQGALPFPMNMRHLMQTIPDFSTALTKIASASWMAPQYFIMAGAGKFEGAVVTIDRAHEHLATTPPIQRIQANKGIWHLLQTNDDVNKPPPSFDPRRPLTENLLATKDQHEVNEGFVWDMIRAPTLFNPLTAFTWVATPATGYHETIVHSESPPQHLMLLEGPLTVQDSRKSIKMSDQWRQLFKRPLARYQMLQGTGA
eukprot:TRINITY_DN4916_c0_g1_i4.p1 TRINITY_DN4916_c0_g1~~TRINITY_DN4916_c0_g1_i4.p1  ORF type:complete len:403 (+),score=66.42 TRINITY_DN4916_c0_g1_i4:66-1274(+)